MKKRDFFILVIKLFGLSSLINAIFFTLPTNLGNLNYAFESLDWGLLSIIIFTLIITIGLFVMLIFKSEKVVDLLKLDKGFVDDQIELGNLNSEEIIKLAAFVIGGMIIIETVPNFLNQTYWAFKGEIAGIEFNLKDKFNWIVSGINLLVGYLLINNYEFVTKLFTPNKKVQS